MRDLSLQGEGLEEHGQRNCRLSLRLTNREKTGIKMAASGLNMNCTEYIISLHKRDTGEELDMVTSFRQQARDFHLQQIESIREGTGPVRTADGPKIIVHVIPVQAMSPLHRIDLTDMESRTLELAPMRARSYHHFHGHDGFFTSSSHRNESSQGYFLVRRTGSVEAVDTSMLSKRPAALKFNKPEKSIPSLLYEEEICSAVRRALNLQVSKNLKMPTMIQVSLIGVKGYHLGIDVSRLGHFNLYPIEVDDLVLPGAYIDPQNQNVELALRFAFDEVWQSAGLPRSFNYDRNGNWIGSN